MFKHNLVLIYRNFKRFKSTFYINLVGLSTGLACTLLIYLWVADELGVDMFHEKKERIFQVMTNQNRPDAIVTLGEGPGLLADAMSAEFPEIALAASTAFFDDGCSLSADNKHLDATGQFAGEAFFDIFSYQLLAGNKKQVLSRKDAIVISEGLARALFHTTDNVVGKTITWQAHDMKKEATVTGIFRNIPHRSSRQFDFVLSYELFKELAGDDLHWGNHSATTYVLLKDNVDTDAFNGKIEGFVKTKQKDSNLTLFVKPYADLYLYGKYENGKQSGGRIEYVRLFSIIAIFILAIACINFMNLTTAKASRRLKEVGIKKAIGAGRRTLITQYMAESLVMTFISLSVAILMVDLLLPQFNNITGKQLYLSPGLLLSFAGIAAITGFISGSYPALYLSRFNTIGILKGRLGNTATTTEQWARKSLVVLQFTLSIIFIVSVLVIYRQIEYVQNKNLGYNKDNIIYFKISGNITANLDTFLEEVKKVPGVANASSMWGSIIGNTSFTTGEFQWEGRDPDEVIQFEHLGVNYGMLELLGITMAAGRSFSRDYPSEHKKIILNEAAIEVMGLKDPVGKTFKLWGNDLEIIGIAKDFHFKSLHENVKPFFFRITPQEASKIMVKIERGMEEQTIAGLQQLHGSLNPGYAFDYHFLDSEYQALYAAEKRVAQLSQYFAALAIIISCLGLFGLAAFTAERRLKEIGIRKALGSGVAGIIYLLSADFARIVFISIVIALPLSYFLASQWLNGFAFRITLAWWYFAGAGMAALLIACFTVSLQALKAARVNPVKCLRDE